jgi:hypothetical protein
MADTLIEEGWSPHKSTINAIKRRHISKKQYVKVYKEFMKRYEGEHVTRASATFYAMFDGIYGEESPKPDLSKEKEQDKKRLQDIDNKPENAVERAEETKTTMKALTRKEALEWLTAQGRSFNS